MELHLKYCVTKYGGKQERLGLRTLMEPGMHQMSFQVKGGKSGEWYKMGKFRDAF